MSVTTRTPTLAEVQDALGRFGWLKLDVRRVWNSGRSMVEAEWRVDDGGVAMRGPVKTGTFETIEDALRAVVGERGA